uniref:T9SS type A sorting domain-containing protein n=1 Tax=Winogradskyella sp. A3E31 TaxID=3349637 RepID=UPI00398AE1CD
NAYSAADGTTIWVRSENADDNSCYGTASFMLTVYDNPDFDVMDLEDCEEGETGSQTFDLTSAVTNADPGTVTYSDADGVIANPAAYSADIGTTEITVRIDNDNDGDEGCYTEKTFDVDVYANPDVDVQIGDTTLCVVAGDITTVTAAPLPPGSYDYVWTVPVGWTDPNEIIVGDNPGNVASFDTGLIGVYSVTITNTVTGCTAMGSGTINPVFEQVDPISFEDDYCASDAPATLFVEGPEGVDLVWYKVVDGEKILVPDDELGENGYPLAPTVPGEYLFIVEQAIGDCETSSDALSTITVNPNPDCDISGPTDVCEDIQQTYTYSGGSENVSYLWSISGAGDIDTDPTASSVDVTGNGVGSYTLTLMVTDNETGCTSTCNYEVTTYDCCDSETAFGYDNGGNPGTSNICFLSDEAEDLGLNTNRWGWTIEGLDLETDISADPGNQYNSYTFELYAANGNSCDPNEGPGTLVGDVTVTRVGDNLVATYDVSGAPEGFDYKLYTGHFNASCDPFPIKRKGRMSGGGNPRFGGIINYTVAPGQYTESADGNGGDTVVIEIPVSEMDGCLNDFYVIAHAEVDICTTEPFPNDVVRIADIIEEEPVDEVQLTGDFNMYPIPFKNEINVQYNFNYDTDVNISVYDLKGVMVYSKTFNGYSADTKGSATIDMSRQSNQMFFVKVSTNRDVLTKTAVSEGK